MCIRDRLNIDFPVKKFPSKPNSIKLKKNSKFSGKLLGVKGQYLIFDDDTVFNIRSNEGVKVSLEFD